MVAILEDVSLHLQRRKEEKNLKNEKEVGQQCVISDVVVVAEGAVEMDP